MQADAVPQAGEIVGSAEVIDTATLKIGGRVLRLFGVVWVRGGQTEELARYLGKRTVTCQPVAGSDAHLCSVDGRDLSEVVLFNGGGRASPEATPDLVAAEDRARSERLGVWAR
jgi:endonuclease YncB( thermonuclease family)